MMQELQVLWPLSEITSVTKPIVTLAKEAAASITSSDDIIPMPALDQ